ncbi:MAG: aminoglycoside phosphotransferase family protein [Gammaproteobacteria bacterium]
MTSEAATVADNDRRLETLSRWAADTLALAAVSLVPASEDASFRRYFRLALPNGDSLIAMDAPPEHENLGDFTRIAWALAALGLHVPHVIAEDATRGFALITDLGRETYLMRLAAGDDPEPLYPAAIAAQVRLQEWRKPDLPSYDAALLNAETALFEAWLLDRHLGLELVPAERALLAHVRERLTAHALAQPRVAVHRDYHSRNLMVSNPLPGVLDFQDAVVGPVTYDLVSLLKDCYIVWPQERRLAWLREYREQALAAGIPAGADENEFIAWFDAMGMQRHLKATGIFARLFHRDGKPDYLADIPRTLNYVVEAAGALPEFTDFADFLRGRVLPALEAAAA